MKKHVSETLLKAPNYKTPRQGTNIPTTHTHTIAQDKRCPHACVPVLPPRENQSTHSRSHGQRIECQKSPQKIHKPLNSVLKWLNRDPLGIQSLYTKQYRQTQTHYIPTIKQWPHTYPVTQPCNPHNHSTIKLKLPNRSKLDLTTNLTLNSVRVEHWP